MAIQPFTDEQTRVSTFRSHIAAMGGNLKLVVEFPGCPPVILTNYSDLADGELPKLRRRRGNGTEAVAWR